MIDTVQAVLLFVIVLLTILFVVLGIQVFYILKDLRQTIQKTNLLLDEVEELTSQIKQPVSAISSLISSASNLSALGTVAKILTLFRRRKD